MTEKTDFKPGDFVQLKAGGPKMVIESSLGNGDSFKCTWFSGSKHNTQVFKGVALQYYDESTK